MTRTIKVTATPTISGWMCQVGIEEDGQTVSDHTVEVTKSDLKRLAPGGSVDGLVKRSFDFLLAREPPQSILRRFALADIEHYFPEFARVISAPTRPS